MAQSISADLRLNRGEPFSASFGIYSDPRLKNWRGTWNDWRVYEVGEGSFWEGVPYVAILATQHCEPGVPPAEVFWSPLVPKELSGYEAQLVCEEFFTAGATVGTGSITASAAPALFSATPNSAGYFLRLEGTATASAVGNLTITTVGSTTASPVAKSSEGATPLGASVSFPVTGQMIFRQP